MAKMKKSTKRLWQEKYGLPGESVKKHKKRLAKALAEQCNKCGGGPEAFATCVRTQCPKRKRPFIPLQESRAEFDRIIIENADYFTATIFLGRARFSTVWMLSNLEEARKAAHHLMSGNQNGRDAMIYAVKDGVSAHVENVKRMVKK